MSLPEFPTTSPPLSREEAINQIISSIAMEELGLSHVINAEGEKLQYVLGTIEGVTGPDPAATIEDVLKVNESVRMVLQSAAESQSLLRNKLQNALSSAVLTGPTGPTGPPGVIVPGTTLFTISSNGDSEEMIAASDLQFESDTLDITVEAGPVIKIENPNSASTIIPFSSGTGAVIQTGIIGERERTVIVGNGGHSILLLSNDPIDLPVDVASQQLTFSMPSNGLITALSVFVSVFAAAAIAETILTIQIYSSDAPDNRFAPITETQIELRIPGGAPIGLILFDNLENLSIPVSTNTRLAVGVYAETPNLQSTPSIHLTGSIMIDLLPPEQP